MKSAPLSRSTSGTGTAVISGISGKRIYVFGYVMVSEGTVGFLWEDSDGTDLSGRMPLVANSGASAPCSTEPWFIVPEGKSLHANLDASVLVAGHVAYVVK